MIDVLGPGDHFGETVIQDAENTISHQTITVEQQSVCGILTQASIESAIGSFSPDVERQQKIKEKFGDKSEFSFIHLYAFISISMYSCIP